MIYICSNGQQERSHKIETSLSDSGTAGQLGHTEENMIVIKIFLAPGNLHLKILPAHLENGLNNLFVQRYAWLENAQSINQKFLESRWRTYFQNVLRDKIWPYSRKYKDLFYPHGPFGINTFETLRSVLPNCSLSNHTMYNYSSLSRAKVPLTPKTRLVCCCAGQLLVE